MFRSADSLLLTDVADHLGKIELLKQFFSSECGIFNVIFWSRVDMTTSFVVDMLYTNLLTGETAMLFNTNILGFICIYILKQVNVLSFTMRADK